MFITLLISLTMAFNGFNVPDYTNTPEVMESVLEREYELVMARVTAYAPFDNKSGTCNNGDPMNTATMTLPQRGTLAVDPRKVPYGTKVYIPGYGEGTAEDTGGAMRNYEGIAIDVFVDTYKEAREFGVQYVEIKVYKEVK
jgi:3D (Asp-Asp-Asp) domain-containing protein